MKAKELLQLYAEGRRDFRGENLRGQSFRGQNLSGVDFSGANIKNADFGEAILRGCKFERAKTGLSIQWLMLCLFLVFAFAFLWGIANYISFSTPFTRIFETKISLENKIFGWISLGVPIVLWIYFIIYGTTAIIISGIIAGCLSGSSAFIDYEKDLDVAINGGITFALAITVLGILAGIIVLNLTKIFLNKTYGFTPIFLTISTTLLCIEGFEIEPLIKIPVMMGALIQIFLSSYVAKKTIEGDARYRLIRNAVIFITCTNGTSFENADLTDTNFSSAILKNTNLAGANLTRACWYNIIKLDYVKVGKSYLDNPQIRKLVRTGQGEKLNFDRLNLQGINLQNAHLQEASFIGTNLNDANLQDADLSKSKLVQTQLDKADLTRATLTGATIEDWNITSHTKLDEVKCRYVFMRLTEDNDSNRHRKPDNWNEEFKDGDFADFIKPIVDTLDLYHNQQVDPRAIAIALKELAENNPDAELEIVAMEKRGKNNFLLRLATAFEANRSQLSSEYFKTYNKIKALAKAEIEALLDEKDNRIVSLETMITTALQRPNFYLANTIKEVIMTEIYQKGQFGIGHMSGGEIKDSATVGGIIYEAEQQNLADAVMEVQQILQQLSQTYPTETMSDRITIANEAIKQIEANPTVKQRLINAATEGGLAVIEKAFDNPIGALFVGVIKGWKEAE